MGVLLLDSDDVAREVGRAVAHHRQADTEAIGQHGGMGPSDMSAVSGFTRRRLLRGAVLTAGLGVLAGCALPRAPWERALRTPIIGYVGAGTSGPYPALLDGFRDGLRELGYIEGSTIDVRYRFTDESINLAQGFIAELVALPVDVLVVTGLETAAIARKVTGITPIVGTILGPDPVGNGLILSLARPGANLTGLTAGSGSGLTAKRLQLLKEVRPEISRVGILWNAGNTSKQVDVSEARSVAPSLGMELQSLEMRGEADLDGAFRALASSSADAIAVLQDPLTAVHSARIIALVNERRIPAIYEVRLWMDAGGLMHYGINSIEQFRRAASYVDRILRGASPSDLPVERPDKLELVINLAVAHAIDLSIPASVLAQATEVLN